MTPKEIYAELRTIKREVGKDAFISLSITEGNGAHPVHISLYPYGMMRNEAYLSAHGDDFAETIKAIHDKWTEYRVAYAKTITRRMALAIIRETDEYGRCTDAALRHEFDGDLVTTYGAAACELADTMVSKGPFTITRVAKANAA